MGRDFKVRLFGKYANFTRPELKAEQVSYPIPTPSALQMICEQFYWQHGMEYVIDRIHVMKPIRNVSIPTNGISEKISISNVLKAMDGETQISANPSDMRVQRCSLFLYDVEYIIEAHWDQIKPISNAGRLGEVLMRRLRKGQCYRSPYFGIHECRAFYEYLEGPVPKSPLHGEVDLGFVFYGFDYDIGRKPMFFHAIMKNGIVNVPRRTSTEVVKS